MTTTEQAARLGALTEVLHAVVYFAPEPAAAYAELGLRGYWRGYFASRAAALGRPSAELVTALFAGFAPAFVARAIPQVWSLASPEAVLVGRRQGAVAALRRLVGDQDVRAAAERTGAVTAQLELAGRPLAAAHAALPRPVDPLAALWHDCTVLREHRGDGYLAAVTAAGLRWPEPHLLGTHRVDPRQQELRGWQDEQWQAAQRRVAALGPAGPRLHDDVERVTDELAATAYEQVDAAELIALLEPLAAAVVAGGGLPFPNAMGLVSPAGPATPPPSAPAPGTPAAGA
jgi:hypothetical protein